METPKMDPQDWTFGESEAEKIVGFKMRSTLIFTPKNDLGVLTPPTSEEYAKRRLPGSDETPRSSRTSLGITNLPQELTTKCSIDVFCDNVTNRKNSLPPVMPCIIEEPVVIRDCLKRCSTDIAVSPKKKAKLGFKPMSPKLRLMYDQKENSPIKIDIEWFDRTSLNRPLFLKPPPHKFSDLFSEKRPQCNDIITNLAQRNMHHVVQKILGHLQVLDLVNVAKVSKSWQSICSGVMSDKLSVGKQMALTSKENIYAGEEKIRKARNETTPRKLAPILITNKLPSPKRRIPESPQLSPNSKRFCYYLKEGKGLDKTEQLTKCPKCSYPAKYSSKGSAAECSLCKFKFCVRCRCTNHPFKECNYELSLSPSPKKDRKCSIGSIASKKALRRLL